MLIEAWFQVGGRDVLVVRHRFLVRNERGIENDEARMGHASRPAILEQGKDKRRVGDGAKTGTAASTRPPADDDVLRLFVEIDIRSAGEVPLLKYIADSEREIAQD